jgi:cytidylate kinase
MIVTVGGLPGTGTSTLCKLLAADLNLPYVYAGQLFRDEASSRSMSLAEFGALCEADPSVDKALDAKQLKLLRAGDVLLEGRLSGWLAASNDVPALKVWLTCDDAERIRRITERDGEDPEVQGAKTRAREVSERGRYQAYYGVRMGDLSHYDLVLDSTSATPEELLAQVKSALSTQS